MSLAKEPFRRYTLGDAPKEDTFTVKLNAEERAEFERCKALLEQKRDSTALKQLASIGAKVLLSGWTGGILQTVFINKRRNARRGEPIYDAKSATKSDEM